MTTAIDSTRDRCGAGTGRREMSAIEKAAALLRDEAESIKASHTLRGDWCGDPTEADYHEMIAAADAAIAERDALRAKIAEMERQEPVGWLLDGDFYEVRQMSLYKDNEPLPGQTALYALPGAQPAPSLASGDVSLISEGKTQPAPSVPTALLVAVADLVAQMEIVARIGFVDAPDDKDSCAAFCVAEGTWLELMSAVESLASALAAAPEAKP